MRYTELKLNVRSGKLELVLEMISDVGVLEHCEGEPRLALPSYDGLDKRQRPAA